MKPFMLEGEEFAEIVHRGDPQGRQYVDVKMDMLTPGEARKLAKWLLKAADEVEKYNRKIRKTPEADDE